MTVKIKRFDVVLVDFGNDIIGSEQGGIRPAVVVQNDDGNLHSSTTIVMPLTKNITKNSKQPTHALLYKKEGNGLRVNSMILGECIRQISEKRILKHLGSITNDNQRKDIKKVYDANFGMGW